MFHNWAFSWPANRRVMYNRASADKDGKPWDATRVGIKWNGEKWVGDVPDMKPDAPPGTFGAFIMMPEGLARIFAPAFNDGPLPEHYEAVESPVANPLHPAVTSNPAFKKFSSDKDVYGARDEFPIVCTTYRLTEHFHYWTKHALINAILQPEQFVEIGEELAKEKGVKHGDKIKVRSKRGEIVAIAVVTKRIRSLDVEGKRVHTVGIPIHWGFKGETKPGYLANTLTPFVGDANTNTPEFKAFLVNVEKA
jgi:anaerobic selenocysteine-containing dehydrogenase